MNNKKELLIIRAVTIICFLFGVFGVALAIVSDSSSMLLDGLYSLIQSIFILLSGYVVKLIGRKDDEYYQFGYGAFEPFFIIIRTSVLIGLNLVLGYNAVRNIVGGGYRVNASIALAFTFVSAIICFIVAYVLVLYSKRLSSPILKAESKSWINDALLSVAVLISFGAMGVLDRLGLGEIAKYIDPAITLIFVFTLVPGLIKLMVSSSRELLTAAPPEEVQAKLDQILSFYQKRFGFSDYSTFSAKLGRTLTLTVYIKLGEELGVRELDGYRKEILKAIQKEWPYSDSDIVFTIDTSWMKYSIPASAKEIN